MHRTPFNDYRQYAGDHLSGHVRGVETIIGASCNQTVAGHCHFVSNRYPADRAITASCYAGAGARSLAIL
jgi:hypothetical protein